MFSRPEWDYSYTNERGRVCTLRALTPVGSLCNLCYHCDESVCGLGYEREREREKENFEEVEDGKITTDWIVFQILVFSSNLPTIIFFQSHKIPAPSILLRLYTCIQRDKHIYVCFFHCIQK